MSNHICIRMNVNPLSKERDTFKKKHTQGNFEDKQIEIEKA